MGIDIVLLAYKHKLDISSPKAFAKDISKRFSANIIMKKEDEDYNIIEMFRSHHENAQHDISIIMKVITDEYKRLYEVSIDNKQDTSFDVYPCHVDLYLTESPFRWHGFETCIWNKDTPDYLEILIKYRNYIKKISNILGCTKCLYIPDQGYTEFLWDESQKGLDYDELIEYIRKRKYLKKCKDKERPKKTLVLNLPDFLSKPKDYEGLPDVYLDVVMDDFHDLK